MPKWHVKEWALSDLKISQRNKATLFSENRPKTNPHDATVWKVNEMDRIVSIAKVQNGYIELHDRVIKRTKSFNSMVSMTLVAV